MRRAPSTIDAVVSGRLAQLRKAAGLTQEKLGDAVGITFQQIQKYERGANRISAGRLFEIARVLDVSVDRFFEGIPATAKAKARQ